MKQVFFLVSLCVGFLSAQGTTVTPIGPSGGMVSLLQGSLTDDVVIASLKEGGLFRSTDGGNSWNAVSINAPNGNTFEVRAIVVHPVHSDTVLLATSLGLFRSADKGATFSLSSSFPAPTYSIEYSPANSSVLFGSDQNGPLQSTNGGAEWKPIKDGTYFGNRTIYKMAVHPSDTGATVRLLAVAGSSDEFGIYFSPNTGKTWKPFVKSLPEGSARNIYGVSIDTMGTGKFNFRAVIATAQGIYGAQTSYNDTAWIPITANNNAPSGVVTDGILVYDKFDLTAPLDDRHKFALYYVSNASEFDGTPKPFTEKSGLFKIGSKYNSLFTISLIEPPPVKRVFNRPSDISALFIPSEVNKGKIYLGTSGGIYISLDDGLTWERKNFGITRSEVRNVVALPSVTGAPLLFAGSFGGGVMRSADGGTSWNEVNNGLSSPYVMSLTADTKENLLYAGTSYSIYRSVDRGLTWTQLFAVDSPVVRRPTKFTNRDHEIIVRHSPAKSTNVLFSSKAFGLYLSTNGGGTWNRLLSPAANDSDLIPEHIEFDPVDPFTIYFSGQGLFRSTNAGQSWTDISSNLPKSAYNPNISGSDAVITMSPSIDPSDPKRLFIATVFGTGEGVPYRLFRSIDSGASWDSMGTSVPVYDVAFDRFDTKRMVASGPAGLFRTVNGGDSWINMNSAASSERFFLIGNHHVDPSVYYSGSEHGGYRIVINEHPKLSADTGIVEYGTMRTGSDSLRYITLSNVNGARNVLVTIHSISDSVSFSYNGPRTVNIAAGTEKQFPVLFHPQSIGHKTALMRFTSTDPSLPVLLMQLHGHAFDRLPFDDLSVGFGPVTIGKDSLVEVAIPNQGTLPLTVTLSINSNPSSFTLQNGPSITFAPGSSGTLSFRFTPRSMGEHRASMVFTTDDVRFPVVKFILSGSGVQKNYMARTVLLDTTAGGSIEQSEPLNGYYRTLRAALERAGLSVQLGALSSTKGLHSIVLVQPSRTITGAQKDTLQQFVAKGGTLVLLADHRDSSARLFNELLSDGGWKSLTGVVPGFTFNGALLIDSLNSDLGMHGSVTAASRTNNSYTAGADTLLFHEGTFLQPDTSAHNIQILYSPASTRLSILTTDGNSLPVPSGRASVVHSSLGSGRIIAIADPELWWNGMPDDTMQRYGISAAGNLRFALNIFGSVENIVAELREMVEERYELISIPYAFSDSSVSNLFKDLGGHNSYLWRMFGKYSTAGGYKEYPTDFSRIRRGEGYWLISKEKKKINLGKVNWPGVTEDYEMTVPPGFSMIGNPFPYTVSWTNSFRGDSVQRVLWGYTNGDYDTTTTVMEPFKGYWIFNRSVRPQTVRINASPVTGTSLQKREGERNDLAPEEWKAQVRLHSHAGTDAMNFIGVLSNARDGWDDEDFVKPPSSPSSGAVLAVRNHGVRLSADYRAFNTEGNSWDCSVTGSSSDGPLRFSVDMVGELPDGFSLYIIDLQAERIYDTRLMPVVEFTFSGVETSRSFRLIAGTSGYVGEHSNGIPMVPLEYSLSQNFPNPFNPSTAINYTLAHSGKVKLDIFNVLGQKVRTLVDAQQGIGAYSVTWDGKDNHGILLSSGIYYYQIQANLYRSVKKMTLVK